MMFEEAFWFALQLLKKHVLNAKLIHNLFLPLSFRILLLLICKLVDSIEPVKVKVSSSWGCSRGECVPRTGSGANGEGVADVLLSLKHAVVHPGSPTAGYYPTGAGSTTAHHYSQDYVQNLGPSVPGPGHYGSASAMSVNVSMNMTMNMNMHSG